MDEQKFQSQFQIKMLRVHETLCKIAAVVYSPVRNVLDSFTNTEVFHMKGAKLRVIR